MGGITCARIGPDSVNVTGLAVYHVLTDDAGLQVFKDSIVAVLTAAMVTGKEVRAYHGDYDSEIVGLALPKPLD